MTPKTVRCGSYKTKAQCAAKHPHCSWSPDKGTRLPCRKDGSAPRDVRFFPPDKVAKTIAYDVHDNGGRPFRVKITPTAVEVFQKTANGEDYDEVVVKPTKYVRIFIGRCPQHPGSFGDGNSVLVQLSKRKHLFIGPQVETFVIRDEIVGYLSPINGSDVSYAYAVGKKNTYLMGQTAYLPNTIVGNANPYSIYYGHHIVPDLHNITDRVQRWERLDRVIKDWMMSLSRKYPFARRVLVQRQ